jgi:hypothetical protein
MTSTFRRRFAIATLAFCALAATFGPAGAQPAANDHTVLILGGTVSGGASSLEAQMAIAAGMDVEVVTDAQWAAKSAADFGTYRAIILGDPVCGGLSASTAAATANAGTWGPAVDGPVVIMGSDPTFHSGQGGSAFTQRGVAFAVSDPAKTGAYITLSCYYHGTAPATPVPLLDAAFGPGFTVTGVGCFNNVHIVATHPALTGLTDANLSNWNCSVHEAFDGWPLSFEVLALAVTGTAYTAPDGTVGTPYIIARGVDVISDIHLDPESATNPVGTPHTLTATVTRDGAPVVGTTVTFRVIDGPHEGTTGTDATDSGGFATFTYTGTAEGVDLIEATFVDHLQRTQRSNRVTKTWGEGDPGGDDKVPPTIDCPDDIVFACTGGTEGRVVEFIVTANDIVDTNPTLVCVPESGSVFPVGTTTVVCTATDDAGNSASCSFTITIGGGDCPRSQGYWKNHADAWPVTTLELGDHSYGRSQLISLLKAPVRGDASLILAKQLIAAKLNAANCAGGEGVSDMIEDADDLIGSRALPADVRTNSSLGKQMTALGGSLERFNTGLLTPDCGDKKDGREDKGGSDDTGFGDLIVMRSSEGLLQNQPNPFKSTTTIGFSIARETPVKVSVFDIQGREIRVLTSGMLGAGDHTATWDGTDLHGRRVPTGVYLYRMEIEGQQFTKRMVMTD